jgi:hypothetical protein
MMTLKNATITMKKTNRRRKKRFLKAAIYGGKCADDVELHAK